MADLLERLNAALADRYRLERELGAGGMALVYLAEDLRHHRRVAVKVLRADLAAALGPDRFVREVTIAANLQHPHILPLHDSGEADGLLFYVMPFVDGLSLRQKLVRAGELPIPDAVRILRDVADAMAYAHRQGVVHRDIKPENVMLSDRHALVTDFGVAKAVSDATGLQSLTTAGVAIGTPTYMAPEQAVADPHTDHRADIYAFGVLAYELLTGSPPFAGLSRQAVLASHVTRAAEPVTAHRASIPPLLASLVMKCLEKKPADRWQSADELIPQLEAVLTPSGGMTPTATQPFAVAPAPKTGRTLRAIGAAGVLVIAAVVAIFALRRDQGTALAHTRAVVLPFENRTGNASWDHLSLLAADYIARSLLETGLLQVVPVSASDPVTRALRAKPEDTGSLPERVAIQVGARLAVSGAYYLAGDSLRLVVEVTDAAEGTLLKSLDPVLASATDPMPGLERVRRAVAGALAWSVDPLFGDWASRYQTPPSYESAKAVSEAVAALFRSPAEAQRLAHEAFAQDTTHEFLRVWEAVSYLNLGEMDPADSLAKLSEARRSRLGSSDRILLAWLRANLDGDRQAVYRATQEGVKVAPHDLWRRQLAQQSIMLNRPREALAMQASIDPRSPMLEGHWLYWGDFASAYHMLGEHGRELGVVRKGRKQYPQVLGLLESETAALAAMGRVDEVTRALDESLNLPPQPGFTPGSIANSAGLEFLAHGDSGSAMKAFARSVAWYERLSEKQRDGEHMGYGEALYNARRFSEAADVFGRGCAATPGSIPCLGWAGTLRAAQGRREEALAFVDEIGRTDTTPRLRIAYQAIPQARIYAALDDEERAVEALRRVFAHGYPHGSWWHRDFNSLRNYPPFQELIRPKD